MHIVRHLKYSHVLLDILLKSFKNRKKNQYYNDHVLGPVTTTSLLVPGPSMETGELEIVETSLIENIEMPSVALGIPAPRNYVEDDGPEWRELDYLVKVIINIVSLHLKSSL